MRLNISTTLIQGVFPWRCGDDVGHVAQLNGGGEVVVGGKQDGHRADPRQRRNRGHGIRAGVHQHTDVGTLTNTDGDEAAHRVVDALIDHRIGVDPILEKEAFLVGGSPRLFGDQPAE